MLSPLPLLYSQKLHKSTFLCNSKQENIGFLFFCCILLESCYNQIRGKAMELNEILREYKQRTNVTNDFIAERVGVTKSTVSRWLSG